MMKFQAYNSSSFTKNPYFSKIPDKEKNEFLVLSLVHHFKTNNYVLENLINWSKVPADPIYKLVFPRKEMISNSDFELLRDLQHSGQNGNLITELAGIIKKKLAPKFVQASESIPYFEGKRVQGAYRNFAKILNLFPSPMVRSCHTYCNYCYCWNLFNNPEIQKSTSYSDPMTPLGFLKSNPEISEILFTGADPLIISAGNLRKFVAPILELKSIDSIRINTKSIAWWPFRFTQDKDADDLIEVFKTIQSSGKHLTLTAHFTHPRELEHPEVAKAVQRIRNTGAIIRTQGPLIRGVNDSAKDWAEMWTRQIKMGMIPYYMFMEADHHPQQCFRVPMAEALQIFQDAQKITTGLARTVRGPVFMYDLNRVLLDGTTEVAGQKYFVLKTLQAPPGCNSEGDIKLVPYDEKAMDLGNLYELFNGESHAVST